MKMMNLFAISDQNPAAMSMFRRHYSKPKYQDGRRHVGGVMPPGEHLFLMTPDGTAIFGWLRNVVERYDGQTGVCCSVFRNEGPVLSSELISEAMELAWSRWPGERLWTYVDPGKVRSRNPGYCFQMAGWRRCGESNKGLLIFEITESKTDTKG